MTLGLISPGPDFVIVLKNSLSYSRKHGIYTALGIALGTLVHLTYISLGLGLAIKQNVLVFVAVKYFGAFYLIYIGYKTLRNSGDTEIISDHKNEKMSITKAIYEGFLVNALNPKAMIFFIGVFSVVIEAEIQLHTILLYAAIIFIQTFVWFTLVALFFSSNLLNSKFQKAKSLIDKTIGIIFIVIGVKLLLGKI